MCRCGPAGPASQKESGCASHCRPLQWLGFLSRHFTVSAGWPQVPVLDQPGRGLALHIILMARPNGFVWKWVPKKSHGLSVYQYLSSWFPFTILGYIYPLISAASWHVWEAQAERCRVEPLHSALHCLCPLCSRIGGRGRKQKLTRAGIARAWWQDIIQKMPIN